LTLDLVPYEDMIHARVAAPLSQLQFDALVSFAFSIGLAAFERSDILRRMNANDLTGAAGAMDAWRKTRLFGEAQVLDALVRRRALERAWLLEAEEGFAAPSALVQAQIDHAAAILGAPAQIATMTAIEQAIAAAAAPPVPQRLETVADPVAMRIATILADSPDTALVLTRRTVPNLERHDDPDHNAPAVEGAAQEGFTLTQSDPEIADPASEPAGATPAKPKAQWLGVAMDTVALFALLVMGLGLLGLAALAVSYGAANGGGLLTAAVLGGPGVLAVAMAAFYLVKGTGGRES